MAFLLATVIVCGTSFVIASKGSKIIDGTPAPKSLPPVPAASSPQASPSPPALPVVTRAEAAPPPYAAPSPQDVAEGSGIYRCSEGGSVVYSDQPCAKGRRVDVRATRGFNLAPASGFAPPTQSAVRQPQIEAIPQTAQAVQAQESDAMRAARCAMLDAEIERIDALARRGGSASYQDQLRERRHKVMDEKYRLKC